VCIAWLPFDHEPWLDLAQRHSNILELLENDPPLLNRFGRVQKSVNYQIKLVYLFWQSFVLQLKFSDFFA